MVELVLSTISFKNTDDVFPPHLFLPSDGRHHSHPAASPSLQLISIHVGALRPALSADLPPEGL